MTVIYSGNSAYCYSNSLRMCLMHAGMENPPSVDLIECMTGMPFGATFLKLEPPLFFPSPTETDPDEGITRALETIGWTCHLWRGDGADSAEAKLREALREGPVLVGPLDMGFLPYDPGRTQKRGGDHFLVTLELNDELLRVHDPQLYPFAVLPVADLVRAWNAKDLGYAEHAYSLRSGFEATREVAREQLLDTTLRNARELSQVYPTGPVAFGGPEAFVQVAGLLRSHPPQAFVDLLTGFSLPLGARRCIDAAGLLKMADRGESAELFIDKAKAYGAAQYFAVKGDWNHAAELIDGLSKIEERIGGSL